MLGPQLLWIEESDVDPGEHIPEKVHFIDLSSSRLRGAWIKGLYLGFSDIRRKKLDLAETKATLDWLSKQDSLGPAMELKSLLNQDSWKLSLETQLFLFDSSSLFKSIESCFCEYSATTRQF